MSVIWCVTDPDSGHSIRASDADQLFRDLAGLRDRGRGYVEVHLSDLDRFQLAVGFRADHAVIHLFDEEKVFLLVGDGVVARDAIVEVPIMSGHGRFTGEFVMRLDRAWAVIRDFVESGSPDSLGEWCEL